MQDLTSKTPNGIDYTLAVDTASSTTGRYRLTLPRLGLRNAECLERAVQGEQCLQTTDCHRLKGYGLVRPGIAITPDIREWMDAAEVERTKDPEVKAATLRAQRQRLADDISGCFDEAQARFDRAWDRSDEQGAFRSKAEWQAKAEEARKLLAAFDAEHPEVSAAIKAERVAATERAMWN